MRKGTRSCRACRQRKIKCVRIDNNPVCRRCEELGCSCIEQSDHAPVRPRNAPLRPRNLTTDMPRDNKMAQMEAQVSELKRRIDQIEGSSLSKRQHHIEMPDGDETAAVLEPQPSTRSDPVESDQGWESDASDSITPEQPMHLRVLFDNEQLTTQPASATHLPQPRRRIHHGWEGPAREALRALIPSEDDFRHYTATSSPCLRILHLLFPASLSPRSAQDVIDTYHEICRDSEMDPIILAMWLITVAIMARQQPPAADTSNEVSAMQLKFPGRVSRTVERWLTSSDRVLGSVKGLCMGSHLLRLYVGMGLFSKAWLHLRRMMGMAELMGLPRLSQRLGVTHAYSADADKEHTQTHSWWQYDLEGGEQERAAQVWESLSTMERFLGTVFGLPSSTPLPPLPSGVHIVTSGDGTVNPRLYLRRLMDVAGGLQQLELMFAAQGHTSETKSFAASAMRQLDKLSSETPSLWWNTFLNNATVIEPGHVVQFLHHCLHMRVHLPFLMHKDSSSDIDEQRHRWSACVDICLEITLRYELLRLELPTGIFVSRIMDLYAFPATAILLLAQITPICLHNPAQSEATLSAAVEQVIRVMRVKSDSSVSARSTKRMADTLAALHRFIRHDRESLPVENLTVHLPLLGKVHIAINDMRTQSPDDETAAFRDVSWGMDSISYAYEMGLGIAFDASFWEGDLSGLTGCGESLITQLGT